MEQIKFKLAADAELGTVLGNKANTRANKKYKFDEVFDALLLDFVHTRLNLYDKLTKKEVNDLIRIKWFEELLDEYQKRAGDAFLCSQFLIFEQRCQLPVQVSAAWPAYITGYRSVKLIPRPFARRQVSRMHWLCPFRFLT